MHRAAGTFGLLQTDVTLELVQTGSLAGSTLRFGDALIAQLALAFYKLLMRSFWRPSAWLAGGKLSAQRFDFAFPSPSCAGRYGKIFPASLQFEQQRSGFWIGADLLQPPARRDKAAVQAFLADGRANVVVPPRSDLYAR
jgi:hypothetical protein